MSVLALSPFDLAIAATLVLALAALSLRLQLGVERQLLFSAARSTLQLLLIGVVLKVLFENAQLLWVALMAGVMIMLAGREVMVRQKRRLVGGYGGGGNRGGGYGGGGNRGGY